MKKYIIYSSILLTGLLLGWIIFRTSPDENGSKNESTSSTTDEIWTCSMHPQIRLPEPGDCPICGMDLIPLESNDNSNPLVFEMTENAMKIANIQTTIVGNREINSNGLKLSGKIQADETNSASIVSHIAGRIEQLFISYTGEKVFSGQKIASIYSPKLITAQKELLEAYKVKEVNPRLYEATRNKLKYWKITNAQIENILSAQKVIESFNIYAGYSGIVLNKRVSVGDYLNEGEALFDIQNLNQLWAIFDVYESDLSNIQVGTIIKFKTPSLPNEMFTSTISFVDPIINPNTRTAGIRTTINNQNQKLKPEMFLEGTIIRKSTSETSILVPRSAVLWTGEKSVVYIKLPDLKMPSFEFREITLGEAVGENYVVKQGLKNGEEVVTNGAFVIDASAQLNNQSSMMNRNLLANNSNPTMSGLEDFTSLTSVEFKKQLEVVLDGYLLVKNALVKDDPKMAVENAKNLIISIEKTDMKLLKGESHMFWMKQRKKLLDQVQEIIELKDMSKQRDVFILLSNTLINTTRSLGVAEGKYFVQFCPMADENKGAHWLSTDPKIMNPYFGAKMLTCGSTQETIDKNFKNKKVIKSNSKSPMAGHNH